MTLSKEDLQYLFARLIAAHRHLYEAACVLDLEGAYSDLERRFACGELDLEAFLEEAEDAYVKRHLHP